MFVVVTGFLLVNLLRAVLIMTSGQERGGGLNLRKNLFLVRQTVLLLMSVMCTNLKHVQTRTPAFDSFSLRTQACTLYVT